VVVAENFIRNDTTGTVQQVDAKYELLQRGQYALNGPAISRSISIPGLPASCRVSIASLLRTQFSSRTACGIRFRGFIFPCSEIWRCRMWLQHQVFVEPSIASKRPLVCSIARRLQTSELCREIRLPYKQ
jgi:hypothetical protein